MNNGVTLGRNGKLSANASIWLRGFDRSSGIDIYVSQELIILVASIMSGHGFFVPILFIFAVVQQGYASVFIDVHSTNGTRRYPKNNGVRGNVSIDKGARPDDTVISDGHAFGNDGLTPDVATITNHDRSAFIRCLAASQSPLYRIMRVDAVSYTHLTLPTIYSV